MMKVTTRKNASQINLTKMGNLVLKYKYLRYYGMLYGQVVFAKTFILLGPPQPGEVLANQIHIK
jgi:hypothetical protein